MKYLALILISTVGTISSGFVMQLQWTWFVLPLTEINITVLQMIGLAMFIRYITLYSSATKKELEPSFKDRFEHCVAYSLLLPWIVLLLSYIVHKLQ